MVFCVFLAPKAVEVRKFIAATHDLDITPIADQAVALLGGQLLYDTGSPGG